MLMGMPTSNDGSIPSPESHSLDPEIASRLKRDANGLFAAIAQHKTGWLRPARMDATAAFVSRAFGTGSKVKANSVALAAKNAAPATLSASLFDGPIPSVSRWISSPAIAPSPAIAHGRKSHPARSARSLIMILPPC